jgi:hypothetical protein
MKIGKSRRSKYELQQNGGSRNRKFNALGDQQDFSSSSNFFSKEIISPVHISLFYIHSSFTSER